MTIGPTDGSIVVRTSREGRAAKMGHDLVIDVARWTAGLDDGVLTFEADPDSLVVREGVGGVKPLTDGDRERIEAAVRAKVLHGLPVAFRSTALTSDGEGVAIEGELTLAGVTRPLRAELALDADGVARGTVAILQTDWGITPQSAMMGALRVRDRVDVEIAAPLPAPVPIVD